MSVFPTAKNLCSWASCCPRNDQSSGKVKSTRISRASSYLKPLLVQIVNTLIRSKKHPEFGERYHRIKARRGRKKAIIAACKMLLATIWNIFAKLTPYTPQGFLASPHPTDTTKVLTVAQGLALLRSRGLFCAMITPSHSELMLSATILPSHRGLVAMPCFLYVSAPIVSNLLHLIFSALT